MRAEGPATHGSVSSSWYGHEILYDAYDNVKYGSFSEGHMIYNSPAIADKDSVYECKLLDKECKTLAEFERLIGPYLNNRSTPYGTLA